MNINDLKRIQSRFDRAVMVKELKSGSPIGAVGPYSRVPSSTIGDPWRRPPAIRFGGEEIPPGGWRGGEGIPLGGWCGGEEIPPGGWRSSGESQVADGVPAVIGIPGVPMSDVYRTLDSRAYFAFRFEASPGGIRVRLLHYPDVLDEVLTESSSHPWSASARDGLDKAHHDLAEARRAAATWAETLWAGVPLLKE